MRLLKSEVRENFTMEKMGNYVFIYDLGVWHKDKKIVKRLEILNEDELYYNFKESGII